MSFLCCVVCFVLFLCVYSLKFKPNSVLKLSVVFYHSLKTLKNEGESTSLFGFFWTIPHVFFLNQTTLQSSLSVYLLSSSSFLWLLSFLILDIFRFQILATACLVNFFAPLNDTFDSTPLLPFFDRLINVLNKLVDDNSSEMRRQAVSALSCMNLAFKSHTVNVCILLFINNIFSILPIIHWNIS